MPGRLAARFHCATIAASLLVSFCAGLVVLPHADCLDDVACNPVFITHDEGSHQIGSGRPGEANHAEHCYLCHCSRSFCSLSPTVEHAKVEGVEHVRATSMVAPGRIEWSRIPGRAPPA